jgi:signal transduction histidine kinase
VERGVRFEITGLDVLVNGRPNDLARLFRNLVENAVAHSPSGSTVRIEGRHTDEHVEVIVADEGEGVPLEDRDRIFEPFYRSKRSKSRLVGGSGLGLGIAREVAKSHGGNVTLADSGKGAKFVVELLR